MDLFYNGKGFSLRAVMIQLGLFCVSLSALAMGKCPMRSKLIIRRGAALSALKIIVTAGRGCSAHADLS